MKKNAFIVALQKLENEGLITGINWTKAGREMIIARLSSMMITSAGIDYVETKLGIDKTLDGCEKMKYLASKCIEFGWNEAKDIFTTTLSKAIRGE